MKIEELAQTIDFCTLQDNLKQAAAIMRSRDSDAVPLVSDENSIIGVLTKENACDAIANLERKASAIRISESDFEEVLLCKPDEKFEKVLKKLAKNRIKYAVSVNRRDKIYAVVSLPKMLSRFSQEKKLMKKVLRAMEKINKPLPLVLHEIKLPSVKK